MHSAPHTRSQDLADTDIWSGFNGITLRCVIDASASSDDVEALVARSRKRVAVDATVADPTSAAVEMS